MKRAAILNVVTNQTHMVTIVSDIDGQSETYAIFPYRIVSRVVPYQAVVVGPHPPPAAPCPPSPISPHF